jgi:predicted transcriptional regulator
MVEELEKLKKYLPKGYSIQIAKELGVTQATVTHAMSGKHRRFDIIKRAIELAKESMAIQKELKETVSEME